MKRANLRPNHEILSDDADVFASSERRTAPRARRRLTTTMQIACFSVASLCARDASAQSLPPGHPPIDNGASNDGQGDPTQSSGPDSDETRASAEPSQRNDDAAQPAQPARPEAHLPQSFANDGLDLPPGTVLVRVVDGSGAPVPNVPVRLGSLREGESQEAVTIVTRPDGVAQFDAQPAGDSISYRASVDYGGAHYASDPFQIPAQGGSRVQLVRFDTDTNSRAVVISDARVEVSFQDDRLLVAEHVQIANFSTMALDGNVPHPASFVPSGGLRFAIPQGAIAFRADEESMGDQHVTEEGGAAVMHGSIPPTGADNAVQIAFQYQLRISDADALLDLSMPLPVLSATIVSQAADGMRLEVDGMPPAEARTNENQHILITGRERASQDEPPIDSLRVHLANLPRAAGPERSLAAWLAAAIVLGSVFVGFRNRRRGQDDALPDRKALVAERSRLLEEATTLHRDHASGEIGPETFERRKRQLTIALATVLRDLARSKQSVPERPRALRFAQR